MISIIILNYNSGRLLKFSIKRIRESIENIPYEIIIVDNASSDNSVDLIKKFVQPDKLILNPKNYGFAKGNNIGIKYAKGEFIAICNPDIIPYKGAIEKLVEFMKNNQRCGIAAPKLLNADKTIQYSCFKFPKWYTPFIRRINILTKFKFAQEELKRYQMVLKDHSKSMKVDWCLGAFLLIKKDIIDKIGGFDERYFLYVEDVDLAREVQKLDYEVWYVPESIMIHYHKRASYNKSAFKSLFNKLALHHIISHIKYLRKWGIKTPK